MARPNRSGSHPQGEDHRFEGRHDPAAVVGSTTVVRSLWRDHLGEVALGTRDGVPVRLRLCMVADVEALVERLRRLDSVDTPLVAPALDRLGAGGGRVAIVSASDHTTLAERRRRGPLDTVTAVALGPALLDGLAALRGAGLSHGWCDATSVGVDERGRPRWQDAGIAPPPGDAGEAADVTRLASTLRGAGGLVGELATLVDEVAAGVPDRPTTIAAFDAAWRRLAAAAGLAVPPPGTVVELPGLVAAPDPRRRPRPRTPHPRLVRAARRGTALALAVAAVATVPLARVVSGGASPVGALEAYRPSHAGQRLTYSLQQRTTTGSTSATVAVHVNEFVTVDGAPTLTTVPDGTTGPTDLPLGLGGTTVRVQDGAVLRTVTGGSVRDLVQPLLPGQSWSDTHTTSGTFSTVEHRTLLGPAPLDEPAGHFAGCLVVLLDAATTETATGSAGSSATGTLWYCEGVGLARAVLESAGEIDTIDLTAVA